MILITLEVFYALMGGLFALIAVRIAFPRQASAHHDEIRRVDAYRRRWLPALFWGLLAVVVVFGRVIPPLIAGYLVLSMVVLAAADRAAPEQERVSSRAERLKEAERLRNKLFWPALIVPTTAVLGTLLLDKIHVGDAWLIDPKQATLISLGLGAMLGLAAAIRTTGARLTTAGTEGGRLVEAIGWSLILPQMLAALGGIFAQSGVGEVVAGLVTRSLPTQIPFVAVAAYCFGMMLFTICMGNAFAAFAVITGGIGLPLVVMEHGGNPAIMASIGMLSGYCGTLLTPMAANFNIVPAMLLDLRDKYAIIRAQVPLAAVIFTVNVLLMYFCVFRF